jgi:hypothetical protein
MFCEQESKGYNCIVTYTSLDFNKKNTTNEYHFRSLCSPRPSPEERSSLSWTSEWCHNSPGERRRSVPGGTKELVGTPTIRVLSVVGVEAVVRVHCRVIDSEHEETWRVSG